MFIYPLYVLVPLIIASFIALISKYITKNHKLISRISLIAVIISFLITIIIILQPSNIYSLTWFNFSGFSFNIVISTFLLNKILLFLVSLISIIIFIYSIGYMDTPSEQNRYYFELLIFTLAMMLFAISANFLSLVIGWELLGISSYLLIGFWYHKDAPPDAARKTITTILIGDISMLISIVIFFNLYHTLNFYTIINAPTQPLLIVPLIFLLIAIFTKSAQFPFSNWLSPAMEGPTPVSAFLHSSTMVKAGIFLVMILLPLFVKAHLLYLILSIGIITSIIGATNAFAENHIKKVLAYSTIEDLGLMLVALGLNAIYAALALFIVQTFYKSLLFLVSGYIMKSHEGKFDIHKLSSNSKFILISMFIGAISLAGLFPFSGFFGKTSIGIAAKSNLTVYLILILIEFLSVLYILRWFFIIKKNKTVAKKKHLLFSSFSMKFAILINVILLLISTFVLIFAVDYIKILKLNYLLNLNEVILDTALILIGLIIIYFYYKSKSIKYLIKQEKNAKNNLIYKLLYNNLFMWWIYSLAYNSILLLSELFYSFDNLFNQLIYYFALLFIKIGNVLKRFENGQINNYILFFVFGLIFLVFFFIIW